MPQKTAGELRPMGTIAHPFDVGSADYRGTVAAQAAHRLSDAPCSIAVWDSFEERRANIPARQLTRRRACWVGRTG